MSTHFSLSIYRQLITLLVHYKNHHCHTSTYGFSNIQSAIRTYFVQAYEGKSNTLQQREEGSRRRKEEEEERAGDVITAVTICQKASATNSFVLNVFWWEKLFQHMKNLTYKQGLWTDEFFMLRNYSTGPRRESFGTRSAVHMWHTAHLGRNMWYECQLCISIKWLGTSWFYWITLAAPLGTTQGPCSAEGCPLGGSVWYLGSFSWPLGGECLLCRDHWASLWCAKCSNMPLDMILRFSNVIFNFWIWY